MTTGYRIEDQSALYYLTLQVVGRMFCYCQLIGKRFTKFKLHDASKK